MEPIAPDLPELLRRPTAEERAGAHRERLLVAMTHAVAHKGYAATTVGDVVALARVSRRTFYEHFPDKPACFLAAYDLVNSQLVDRISRAADAADPQGWPERVRAMVSAYLDALSENPALARALMVDIASAGPAALDANARLQQQIAQDLRAAHRRHPHDAPELPPEAFMAFVGAAHTLALHALRDQGTQGLEALRPGLTQTALRLLA
jgi:AcrR family transcriptional regulator